MTDILKIIRNYVFIKQFLEFPNALLNQQNYFKLCDQLTYSQSISSDFDKTIIQINNDLIRSFVIPYIINKCFQYSVFTVLLWIISIDY